MSRTTRRTRSLPSLLVLSSLFAAALLGGCQRGQDAPAPVTAAPATAPAPAAAPTPAAPVTAPAADFDPASVPESTASLPPFPFFKAPDGLHDVIDAKDSASNFDREHMIAGNKVVAIEGKVARALYPLADASQRQYSALEFQRNYENAVTALGGRKISQTQYTDEVMGAFGGREQVETHYHGACAGIDCENNTYLIRQGGKEWWIQVSTGAIPLHGYVVVLEKEGMKQSLGFLDAAAMKKAIDTTGHVALYINFDVDKATLRPDAQPVVDEINKLLGSDPALKLSIEGHTDNTGTAAHNQELSAARARSVLGALVGLGVDPARLSSKGYGQDKPIADNGSEDGRARNRRVELVKQ